LVYWSKKSPVSERYMKEVEEQRKRFPGMFDIYSFNLDELPDAGEKILREMGLDWHAMHLPDGMRNVNYKAYGGTNPFALFVNSFGFAVLNPMGANPDAFVGVQGIDGGIFKISESRLSYKRYLAQLQYLFIGDFLINDSEGEFDPAFPPELKMVANENDAHNRRLSGLSDSSIPREQLKAIQECFILPPFRYRLSRKEVTERYRKAEKLCSEILKEHSDAPDAWIVRNRRIIALLGLDNLLCEPKYLEQAVKEARNVLALKLKPAESVVARFCLAKEALRKEAANQELEIRKMITDSGGDNAPVSAVGAASILAVEANNRALHEEFRAKALLADAAYPMWGLRSLLLNRYHRFYLLKPNSTRGDRMGWTRSHIVNHGRELSTKRFPDISLKKLDGSELKLPNDKNDKLTFLLFIEPPADPDADFPIVKDRKGKPTRNDYIRSVIGDAMRLSDTHVNKSVDVILAFLCDDPKRVENLMKKNEWPCQAAMVPGGLKNPMVQRLGIFSADRVPNVFLLRRDGTIAWHTCGIRYKSEFGYPFAVLLGMKVHIEVCEVEYGLRLLKKGDFKKAAETFAGPFTPARPERYAWYAPRHHGRVLALMGLKDWGNALEAVEVAIDSHKRRHYRYPGRGLRDVTQWRAPMTEIKIKESCDVFSELWATKAIILEKLNRKEEAEKFRKLSESPAKSHGEDSYSIFHNKLKAFRKGMK